MSHDNAFAAVRVDRILRRARRTVAARDLVILVLVRVWIAMTVVAGLLFARWYRPSPSTSTAEARPWRA